MFVSAIQEVSKFTRPIHFITRHYGTTTPVPSTATRFFVNEEGCAVTCKHVALALINGQGINENYDRFRKERSSIGTKHYNQKIKELCMKFGYNENPIIQLDKLFPGSSTEPTIAIKCILHPNPNVDLAIVVIQNFKSPGYDGYARFLADTSSLQPGKFLCRLGYPFPEFTNFHYNEEKDVIERNSTGISSTPRFPIEGMITRHLLNDNKEIWGLEISTPGLMGQSGGPLFNELGLVCGLQFMTHHLHLGFDMKNLEYKNNGSITKINNQPFLHAGLCIHVDVITAFLKENGIRYYEE